MRTPVVADAADLEAAWEYVAGNEMEIDEAIRANEEGEVGEGPERRRQEQGEVAAVGQEGNLAVGLALVRFEAQGRIPVIRKDGAEEDPGFQHPQAGSEKRVLGAAPAGPLAGSGVPLTAPGTGLERTFDHVDDPGQYAGDAD